MILLSATPNPVLTSATLGLTLAVSAISLAVMVNSGIATRGHSAGWAASSMGVVCIASFLIALGNTVFSARRVLLLATGNPIITTQPAWSSLTVIVGMLCTISALILMQSWRASRLRPGSGRAVAFVSFGVVGLSMLGGALAL